MLSPQHVAWLQTLIKVAFKSASSVLIFYAEKQQNYIYLFPTNKPNAASPRDSLPISNEEFDKEKKAAETMLKTMIKKTEFFAMLAPYYTIKIVRVLPAKVKTSDKITNHL